MHAPTLGSACAAWQLVAAAIACFAECARRDKWMCDCLQSQIVYILIFSFVFLLLFNFAHASDVSARAAYVATEHSGEVLGRS